MSNTWLIMEEIELHLSVNPIGTTTREWTTANNEAALDEVTDYVRKLKALGYILKFDNVTLRTNSGSEHYYICSNGIKEFCLHIPYAVVNPYPGDKWRDFYRLSDGTLK